MPKMVDLKRSKKEQTEKYSPKVASDPYSYGLNVDLDKDHIQKLGVGMPKVGDKFHVHAIAHVRSTHDSQHADGGGHSSVSLQLRKMALKKHEAAKPTLKDAVESGIKDADEG